VLLFCNTVFFFFENIAGAGGAVAVSFGALFSAHNSVIFENIVVIFVHTVVVVVVDVSQQRCCRCSNKI
jgi:hypothetical protein